MSWGRRGALTPGSCIQKAFSFSRALSPDLGFAREHVVCHGCVVEEGCHDYGGLLQVVFLNPVHHVLIGVVGAGVVFDGVLDELKAGDTDGIEGDVIGAARVLDGYGGGSEVGERLKPLTEDGPRLLIPLQVDPTDLAGSIVQVVVGADLRIV